VPIRRERAPTMESVRRDAVDGLSEYYERCARYEIARLIFARDALRSAADEIDKRIADVGILL
jgi:hypothetical protein